jgi:threonine dehydrogenase-like Zn-dependent dehydrogenase
VNAAVDNFKMLAGREATLAVVGAHHEPVTWDLRQLSLMNWNVTGCGSMSTGQAIVDVLDMMKSGKYALSSLVTHEYEVDQIAKALVMGGNAQEAQKVCISFSQFCDRRSDAECVPRR